MVDKKLKDSTRAQSYHILHLPDRNVSNPRFHVAGLKVILDNQSFVNWR
jgi:hypothetical protein